MFAQKYIETQENFRKIFDLQLPLHADLNFLLMHMGLHR